MSRIGRAPITIPSGVEVKIDGSVVSVKGPKGQLSQDIGKSIKCEMNDGKLVFTRPDDMKENRAKHGLYRALVNNMVIGVTAGFKRELVINGVGYKVEKAGKKITLSLGYSHPVYFEEADGITYEIPDANTIIVHGIDRQAVGQAAAQIREKRPPEPYLGKGIKYADEHIRRKAGKTGK